MDDCWVFDRTDGVSPFLLLDGHGSRFELPFLEYINNDEYKWRVCIGVPYGTNIWQVGDSAEQNGSFKIVIVWAKTNLLLKKGEACLPFAIEKTDIVLVVQAWRESFAIVMRNKKAIAERGWGPLSFILLDYLELKRCKKSSTGSTMPMNILPWQEWCQSAHLIWTWTMAWLGPLLNTCGQEEPWEGKRPQLQGQCQCMCWLCSSKDAGCLEAHRRALCVCRKDGPWKGLTVCWSQEMEGSQIC